jgi:hypothetical protein
VEGFRHIAVAIVIVLGVFDAPAGAQTTTLEPFAWRADVSVGTSSGPRAISEARVSLQVSTVSGSTALVPVSYTPGAAVGLDPSVARLGALVPRIIGGQQTHAEVRGDGTRSPAFFVDGGVRSMSLLLPGFDAPASGNLSQQLAVQDLCSVSFEVQIASATASLDGLFVTFAQTTADAYAAFGAMGPPLAISATDPAGLRGYVAAQMDGQRVARAELLVTRSESYAVSGSVILGGLPVNFRRAQTVFVDDQCRVREGVGGQELPGGVGGISVDDASAAILEGSLWLRASGATGVDAPRVSSYLMQSADAENASNRQVQSLVPSADVPAFFGQRLRPGSWLLRPRLGLSWTDGRVETLDLPPTLASGWSPAFPVGAANGRLGVYPDASVVLSVAEAERVAFDAPMAFAFGQVVPRGCAGAYDVTEGEATFRGVANGPRQSFLDENGRAVSAATGNEEGFGRTPLVPGVGRYEFVGTPGLWSEQSIRVGLTRVDENGNAFSGHVYLSPNLPPVELVTDRAAATRRMHDLALGEVTVTLRVRNEDGSSRPFRQAVAYLGSQGGGGAATSGARAFGSSAMAMSHSVRLLAPPGIWDVQAEADVPQNPDGTGAVVTVPFPPIRGVMFRPPRADGSCDAVCLDATTGQFYGDDKAPPTVALDAVPPAVTRDSELRLSGVITDESPIDAISVSRGAASLAGAAGDTTRGFAATVPLVEGPNTVTLTVTDLCGERRTLQYEVIRIVNHPPKVGEVPVVEVNEGDVVSFLVGAWDPDGTGLLFTLEGDLPPNGPVIDPSTGQVFWTTDLGSEGTYTFVVVISDGENTVRRTVVVVVHHVNGAPQIVSVGGRYAGDASQLLLQVPVRAEGRWNIDAFDPDGDVVGYALQPYETSPERAWRIEGSELVWRPSDGDEGTHRFVLLATDAAGARDEVDVYVEVLAANRAPVLTAPERVRVREGETIAFDVLATDPDGDALSIEVGSRTTLPADLSWQQTGGGVAVLWATGFASSGTWPVVVSAIDSHGARSTVEVSLVVDEVNRAPWVETLSDDENGFQSGEIVYEAHDPDGDPVTCRVLEMPAGSVFDAARERVRLTAAIADRDALVTLICSDGEAETTVTWPVRSARWLFEGGCGCGGGGAVTLLPLVALSMLLRRRSRSRR